MHLFHAKKILNDTLVTESFQSTFFPGKKTWSRFTSNENRENYLRNDFIAQRIRKQQRSPISLYCLWKQSKAS